MEIDLATCTEEDLWRYVASHLAREGIETILMNCGPSTNINRPDSSGQKANDAIKPIAA